MSCLNASGLKKHQRQSSQRQDFQTVLRLCGYATPEATFQTMLWAAASRDTNTLLSSFDPASKAIIEGQKMD